MSKSFIINANAFTLFEGVPLVQVDIFPEFFFLQESSH
jgi:hypothetical protein